VWYTTLRRFKRRADGLRGTIDARQRKNNEGEQIDDRRVESAQFHFRAPSLTTLNAGFVPVRKPEKLPAEKVSVSYDLELDKTHSKCTKSAEGHKVLIVDDLLTPTGRTAKAVVDQFEGGWQNRRAAVRTRFLGGRQKFTTATTCVH